MKRAVFLVACAFAVWLACMQRPVSAGTLRAGTAVIDITPPVGTGLGAAGLMGNRPFINKGIHDGVYAKVLALSDGSRRVTIVTLDLLGFVPDRVRSLLPAGFENTVFCATHNHMGPSTIDFTPPDFTYRTDYLTEMEDRLAAAIVEAHGELTPVSIGASTGTIDLSYNKLGGGKGVFPCGKDNPHRIKMEPVDCEVGVVRLDSPDGDPIAILVNYASHPVVAWICDKITAEYPGFMTTYVEKTVGGDAVCFFLQGACGDTQPYESCSYAFEPARMVGEKLGKLVCEVSNTIETTVSPESELAFISETIPVKGRTTAKGMTLDVEMTVTVIDNRIAFVSGPGEFYVDFQLDLKQKSPLEHTFFLGYANGYLGYFPTQQAVREDWNKWYNHNMWVEVGSGEKVIERGLSHITEFVTASSR